MTTNPTCPKCGKPLSWLSESQLPERTFPIHIDTGKEECDPAPRIWQYCEHSGTPVLEPTTPLPSPSAIEAAKAIEADHQWGRMEPQRSIDRALLIDTAMAHERAELTASKAELARAKEACGDFVKHPFDGSLVTAINAISLRCASSERDLETSRANEQKLAAEVESVTAKKDSAYSVITELGDERDRERTVRRELARITQWMRDRYEHGIKLLAHNRTPGAGELIADAHETLQQVDAVLAVHGPGAGLEDCRLRRSPQFLAERK